MNTKSLKPLPVPFLGALALALSAALWPAPAADAAQPPAGAVVGVEGEPRISRGDQSTTLKRFHTIRVGDVISTDAQSKVKLLLRDDTILTVGPSSRFHVERLVLNEERRSLQIRVTVGRFKASIQKFFGGLSDVQVFTPTAVAGVRGTILWGDTDVDAMCSLEGTIEVRSLLSDDPPAFLPAGQCVSGMGQGQTAPLAPTPEQLAEFLDQVTLR